MASSSGTTFEAIVEACQQGQLDAVVVGLVSNRRNAGAIERAKRLGVPYAVCSLKDLDTVEAQDDAILAALEVWRPDWVVLAGYMNLIGSQTLSQFSGKMINIHPSLLPKYGGKGMYGSRVHQAVIEAGEKESGVTVHIVTADYDEGPVVAQKRVAIPPNMDWQGLEEKIKSIEKPFYIEVLQKLVR